MPAAQRASGDDESSELGEQIGTSISGRCLTIAACEPIDPSEGSACPDADRGELACDGTKVLRCEQDTLHQGSSWALYQDCGGPECNLIQGGNAYRCGPVEVAFCSNIEWCPDCYDGPWATYNPRDGFDRSVDLVVDLAGQSHTLQPGECTPCVAFDRPVTVRAAGGPENETIVDETLTPGEYSQVVSVRYTYVGDDTTILVFDESPAPCSWYRQTWIDEIHECDPNWNFCD